MTYMHTYTSSMRSRTCMGAARASPATLRTTYMHPCTSYTCQDLHAPGGL